MDYSRGDIKYAVVDADSKGANAVVSAVSGKRIMVVNYVVDLSVAGTAVGGTWQSFDGDATYTDLTGLMAVPFGGSECHTGHFATIRGQALVLDLDDAVQVGGHLSYILY